LNFLINLIKLKFFTLFFLKLIYCFLVKKMIYLIKIYQILQNILKNENIYQKNIAMISKKIKSNKNKSNLFFNFFYKLIYYKIYTKDSLNLFFKLS
jgi:hypothetical protein